MTQRQEIFTTVARHLLSQMERCEVSVGGTCRYRNGRLKCAIGALIPDGEYRMAIEGNTIGMLLSCTFCPPTLKAMAGEVTLLRALQHIHDYDPVHEWEDSLKTFAKEHDLEMPLPQ